MASSAPTPSRRSKMGSHFKLVLVLVAVIAGMTGFGYALVPLYNIVCKLTGLNGKTGGINQKAVAAIKIDKHRLVEVQFFTYENQQMPWKATPMVQKVWVHPGQLMSESYRIENPTNDVITGQAVDSLIPDDAAYYFKKLYCLCFKHHTIGPHQSKILTLEYIVMPGLPKFVHRIYFSYTFFEVSKHPLEAAATRQTLRVPG